MKKRPTFVFYPSQMELNLLIPAWQEAVKVAQEKNFNLIICNGKSYNFPFYNDTQENVIYDLVDPKKIDGIALLSSVIFVYLSKEEQKAFLAKYGSVPLVSIGYPIESGYSLLIDNQIGIKEIVSHLIEKHSCKRIAFVKGPESSEEAQARFKAYLTTLEKYGLAVDDKLIVPGRFLTDDGPQAVKILLDERRASFEALVCANDYMALGACEEFKRRGMTIPDDVIVTGFDNINLAKYSVPSLTTVYQPFNRLARAAFEWLYDIVVNQTHQDEKLRYVPTELIINQSCGCTPLFEDPEQTRQESEPGAEIYSEKKLCTGLSMVLPATPPEPAGNQQEIKKLVDRFYLSLKTGEPGAFLNCLHVYLATEILIHNNEFFYDAVSKMKPLFLRALATAEEKTWCESLFAKAQLLLNGLIKIKWEHSQSVTGLMNVIFRNFLKEISTVSNRPDLLNIIATNLATFNLDQCFITLYKNSTPKKITSTAWSIPEQSELVVVTRNNRSTAYQDNCPIFPTADLLPADHYLDTQKPLILVVRPLYSRDIHFGNIVFSGAQIDVEMYATLHDTICTGLISVHLVQEMAKHTALLEDHKIQLEMANEKLTELDRMKTDFIQNMTHEFRSPLSIIMNSADLALKYDKLTDNQSQSRFSIIYDAALKLNSNIDKLLDLSKMDSNKLKIRVSMLKIDRFLEDIIDFYKSVASLSNIKIEADLTAIKGIKDFYSDQDKLEDIINNIFSNALKFADQKEGKITVQSKASQDSILLTIKDNGIGIEKDNLSKIFERFVQVDGKQNSRFKGTGIGLAFARQLTHLLKGKIWAESEGRNTGTTFFLEFPRGEVVFPAAQCEDDSALISDSVKREKIKRLIQTEIIDLKTEKQPIITVFNQLNKETEFDYKRAVILLVEDNKSILEIEKEYLEREGYSNFILARDGVQGLEAIHRYHPDIVICDYNMPGMRGDELHDKICNAPAFKHLPFIFCTAIAHKDLIKERRQKGAIAYLVKPVEELELIITVNIHLKRYMELKESLYMATVDQLTGLANKKTLDNKLMERVALRKYRHLSLIFMDIDHFKTINDTYGHQAGDEVLRELGAIISHIKRDYDIAGRYGGEEFLLILPETKQAEALQVAKKLKEAISTAEVKTGKGQVKVTASFGISSLIDNSETIEETLGLENLENIYNVRNPKEADWEKINQFKKQIGEFLLKLADNALYEAKSDYCGSCGYALKEPRQTCPQCHSSELKKGRNRVVMS